MNKLSPQRKKTVVLCASAASLGGAVPVLMQRHRIVGFVWIVLMLVLLTFGMAAFVKLKREEG